MLRLFTVCLLIINSFGADIDSDTFVANNGVITCQIKSNQINIEQQFDEKNLQVKDFYLSIGTCFFKDGDDVSLPNQIESILSKISNLEKFELNLISGQSLDDQYNTLIPTKIVGGILDAIKNDTGQEMKELNLSFCSIPNALLINQVTDLIIGNKGIKKLSLTFTQGISPEKQSQLSDVKRACDILFHVAISGGNLDSLKVITPQFDKIYHFESENFLKIPFFP